MTASLKAYHGARIFDGTSFHDNAALLVNDNRIQGIHTVDDFPNSAETVDLQHGILAPGFVDLQVNGGGGVMFNDAPTIETLEVMARAHRTLGATTILPTLITDAPDKTLAAIDAVETACTQKLSGIAGLHLEGPHLAKERKGAHSADLIRPMTDTDLEILCAAADRLPVLKVTLAPESVTHQQIQALAEKRILVSLGHTNATYEDCDAASSAGARCVTHLFNAQSQLGSREPGVVGAALALGSLSAGLIADGIHVHPAAMRLALSAKQGPGKIFLVSDSMATAGSVIDHFTLNGRKIFRSGDRLTLQDGTLAGAHLSLSTAISNMVELCGTSQEKALAMATSIPARLMGLDGEIGSLAPGARAGLVHLSDCFEVITVCQSM
ncbi:N-acetylglucosamine-6-phosphate deacetylase [Roseibium sp. RKSG952]|uniref:N-acetylglucosamine-6-phosphate deacetylase n=1 Tax=Roseibium sp. RKSG952 TaxID=2529384 RepID=UPI0012BD8142|nr:N-acetylglucosamine-6-phosphate deacetylase [Roseibium sp. RKSG952]MTH99083.1 N-acetylglucosamine-6-phosphate deacetylase [Roseibium sp. RKSG952]